MTTRHVFLSLFSAALTGFLPTVAGATNLIVDCDASGPGALAAAVSGLDIIGPHLITVTGTCTENVGISFRERITIQAPTGQTAMIVAANPGDSVFSITYSRQIVLRRLVIRGATQQGRNGVQAGFGSDVSIEFCVIEGNFRGIGVFAGSHLALSDTTVRDSTRAGILLDSSHLEVTTSTIENNGGAGINMAGSVSLIEGCFIRYNGQSLPAAGVRVSGGSTAEFFGVQIGGNNRYGVYVNTGSTASFFSGIAPDGTPVQSSIALNALVGLRVSGSQAVLSGPYTIDGNGDPSDPLSAGIRVENNGSVEVNDGGFGEGGLSQVTGNRGPGIAAVNGGSVSLKSVQVSGNLVGISLDGGTLNALGMVGITNNLGLGLVATGGTVHLNDVLIAGNSAPPPPLGPQGARGGISLDGTTLSVDGKLTVENNNGPALNANGGRLSIRDTTGENLFRNNQGGIGLFNSASASFSGQSTIQSNGNGAGVNVGGGSSAQFNERVLPGGIVHATIIEGHSTTGVNVVQLGAVSFSGRHTIRNNGSASANPVLRAGVRVSRGSFTASGGLQVTNNDAPGVLADFNSSVILSNATVSNNTLDGLVLTNMSIVGLFTPAAIFGNGNTDLTCDGSSLVIGELTGVANNQCKNIATPKK